MNQKQEKKMRRERRKAIREFIDQNEDMVLQEVMVTILKAPWYSRIAMAFCILFKVRPRI